MFVVGLFGFPKTSLSGVCVCFGAGRCDTLHLLQGTSQCFGNLRVLVIFNRHMELTTVIVAVIVTAAVVVDTVVEKTTPGPVGTTFPYHFRIRRIVGTLTAVVIVVVGITTIVIVVQRLTTTAVIQMASGLGPGGVHLQVTTRRWHGVVDTDRGGLDGIPSYEYFVRIHGIDGMLGFNGGSDRHVGWRLKVYFGVHHRSV